MIRHILVILTLLLSSCVYTLNIQQGNILDQKDIDKLRPDLTKNQVVFVLGNPVVDDSFSDDHWIYLYTFSNRMTDVETTKRLDLYFVEDKLVKAKGDFEIPDGLAENQNNNANGETPATPKDEAKPKSEVIPDSAELDTKTEAEANSHSEH